jgi:hypothetical protein
LFQRSRLKYEKLTDGRRTPSDGNTSPDGSGELKTDSPKMSTVKNPTFTYGLKIILKYVGFCQCPVNFGKDSRLIIRCVNGDFTNKHSNSFH